MSRQSIGAFDVSSVDWSKLKHAHGFATDLPALWEEFLAGGPEANELLHTVCHQGTVYTATPALLPFVMAVATSTHPAADGAITILGAILRTTGGELALRARMAELTPRLRLPQTGEIVTRRLGRAPPDEALAEERAWVQKMCERIEAALPTWLELLHSDHEPTRIAAAFLLAGMREHDEHGERIDAALAAALDAAESDRERDELRAILEDADGYDDDDEDEDDDDDDEDEDDDDEDEEDDD